VSGLSAQSYALENISGNIANASTTGFKRVDTAFIDMIPDQPAKHELAGSVSSRSNLTTTLQGTLNTTGISTNAALSGDGFFVVAKNTGSNQSPSFSGQGLYTRRGDFAQDANGYLVNGSGYYLSGTSYDIATGSAVGASNSPIQISNKPIAAKQTSSITYSGNLPSVPQPANYTTPGTELLPGSTAGTAGAYPVPGAATPITFTVNGVTKTATIGAGDTLATTITNLNNAAGSTMFSASGGAVALNANATVVLSSAAKSTLNYTTDPVVSFPPSYNAAGSQAFLDGSVTGGQITMYDALGTAVTTELRWGKISSATSGGSDTWQLYYQADPSSTSTTAVWKQLGSVTFDGTGKMTSPLSGSLGPTNLTVGPSTVSNVAINFGSGLTQYGNASGTVSSNIDQNGYTSGNLTNISIATDGSVVGNYSNGQVAKVAQIGIAQFNASDALKRENGGAYSATMESGAPNYGLNGTTLTGGSVEASNTDISDEFSKMIVTQQAYSANTKVITTAQQMLQDVINIIR
jgi:flagellar hook protein FlgE